LARALEQRRRRRHAQARARRRRRLSQPARPRPARHRRRRAAGDRPHPGRRAAGVPRPVPGRGLRARPRGRHGPRPPPPPPPTSLPPQPARGEGDPQPPIAAYEAWVSRSGSQEAAFTGEASWSPERRFGRVFERLALPGFPRAARFELLAGLGAAQRYPLAADAVHFVEDDATTLAAKRALVSGDRLLLERPARDLAEAAALPLAALDRGLAVWGTPGEHVDLAAEPAPAVAAALALR